MNKSDISKRTFFKKVAAAVGLVAVSAYLNNIMSGRVNSIRAINANSANDVNIQKKAWLRKQLVLMTDNEKKKMLDEIIDIHKKYHT